MICVSNGSVRLIARVVGKQKDKEQDAGRTLERLSAYILRPSFAGTRLLKQVYEVNPLTCPRCVCFRP